MEMGMEEHSMLRRGAKIKEIPAKQFLQACKHLWAKKGTVSGSGSGNWQLWVCEYTLQ